MELFISVGAALLPFFILWYFSESSIEKRVREAEMEYERIVAATAAKTRLEILLAEKPKQPELWWGNECITISQDGKRVIKLTRPKQEEALRAGSAHSDEARRAFFKAVGARVPLNKRGNPMDFEFVKMPLSEKRW